MQALNLKTKDIVNTSCGIQRPFHLQQLVLNLPRTLKPSPLCLLVCVCYSCLILTLRLKWYTLAYHRPTLPFTKQLNRHTNVALTTVVLSLKKAGLDGSVQQLLEITTLTKPLDVSTASLMMPTTKNGSAVGVATATPVSILNNTLPICMVK
jgi:hypothetical protein